MHHCLTISEILHQIFDYCVEQEPYYEPTLAAASRTCNVFYEPAVDALYRNLQDLTPLLKLLPRTLWFEEQEPSRGPGKIGSFLVLVNILFYDISLRSSLTV